MRRNIKPENIKKEIQEFFNDVFLDEFNVKYGEQTDDINKIQKNYSSLYNQVETRLHSIRRAIEEHKNKLDDVNTEVKVQSGKIIDKVEEKTNSIENKSTQTLENTERFANTVVDAKKEIDERTSLVEKNTQRILERTTQQEDTLSSVKTHIDEIKNSVESETEKLDEKLTKTGNQVSRLKDDFETIKQEINDTLVKYAANANKLILVLLGVNVVSALVIIAFLKGMF